MTTMFIILDVSNFWKGVFIGTPVACTILFLALAQGLRKPDTIIGKYASKLYDYLGKKKESAKKTPEVSEETKTEFN